MYAYSNWMKITTWPSKQLWFHLCWHQENSRQIFYDDSCILMTWVFIFAYLWSMYPEIKAKTYLLIDLWIHIQSSTGCHVYKREGRLSLFVILVSGRNEGKWDERNAETMPTKNWTGNEHKQWTEQITWNDSDPKDWQKHNPGIIRWGKRIGWIATTTTEIWMGNSSIQMKINI